MKRRVYSWQWIGFVFTVIAGVLLHFLFDWTGKSVFVAPFSAVNESIWEHLKLLFFPMIIFAWVESRTIVQDYADFWCIKLCGIIAGLVLIPVLYYTINGALGVMPDWVNITIFVIAAAVIFYIETKLFLANRSVCRSFLPARAILLLLAATFVVLTFVSPQLPIFKDPQSGTYGYFETT